MFVYSCVERDILLLFVLVFAEGCEDVLCISFSEDSPFMLAIGGRVGEAHVSEDNPTNLYLHLPYMILNEYQFF